MISTQPMFMSIAIAVAKEGATKSFEEVRMEDYLLAYRTTGMPPVPCPQEPTSDEKRRALGLPPLFKPTLDTDAASAIRTPAPGVPAPTRKADPDSLPPSQDFKGEKVAGEIFYNICCSEPYTSFSPEELRHYAYKQGHKTAPEEQLQSISVQPEFSKHSFEELRVVYMLAGRELTSAEIIAAMEGR